MATTITCDGCDKPIDDKGQIDFRIKASDHNGKSLFEFGPFDICSDCKSIITHNANIKTWTRPPVSKAPDSRMPSSGM